MRFILVLVLAVGFQAPAYADDCMDEAQSQMEMTRCAATTYQESDAILNKLYRQIRERFSGDVIAQGLLRDSQRAWIAFRDAECNFSASASAGGSAETLVRDMCLNDLTRERVAAFHEYLNCEEGDISCPVPPAE